MQPRKTIRTFAVLALLLFCTGCLHAGEETAATSTTFWGKADQKEMLALRRSMRPAKKDDNLEHRLIFESPEKLAQEAAAANDTRLISLAMGYQASAADAKEPFLIKCDKGADIPLRPIVYGCVPPPLSVLKLLARYNDAMIAHPAFPHKGMCSVDEDARKPDAAEAEYPRYPYE
ncbi:MAG TPA: hypothetical protein PLW48_00610 [Alphaproteobacteria bacterium]|nr:hypothetical protein [Rhodospirillaceae bacterium]HRJ65610.1 hypothetical protein [Alphaproteobacteria bacterium]